MDAVSPASADGLPARFSLAGRTAVVTGGNKGIGLGIALGLASAGANIAVWARNERDNAQAAEVLAKSGVDVVTAVCDVSDQDSVRAAYQRTRSALGPADACFAVAGINRFSPFLQTSVEDFRDVLCTNLEGAFLTFQAVVPDMIENGGGSLVGVSSISARSGQPRSCHYAASKAGVAALVKSLAVELARHGIRANTIVPGWIRTSMVEPLLDNDKLVNAVMRRIPQRRWGEPADLAGLAVFLTSEAASYLTGAEIVVDGGYTLF